MLQNKYFSTLHAIISGQLEGEWIKQEIPDVEVTLGPEYPSFSTSKDSILVKDALDAMKRPQDS